MEPRAATAPAGVAGRRLVEEKPRMAVLAPKVALPLPATVTVPSAVDGRGPPPCVYVYVWPGVR